GQSPQFEAAVEPGSDTAHLVVDSQSLPGPRDRWMELMWPICAAITLGFVIVCCLLAATGTLAEPASQAVFLVGFMVFVFTIRFLFKRAQVYKSEIDIPNATIIH